MTIDADRRAEIKRVLSRAQRLTRQRRFIEDGTNMIAIQPDGTRIRLGPFVDRRRRWRDHAGRYCPVPGGWE